MKYETYNLGESNNRRCLVCNYCGHRIMPTRRQRRAKTTRQTCMICGHSSWNYSKGSLAHIENEIAEEIMSGARKDNIGRKIL